MIVIIFHLSNIYYKNYCDFENPNYILSYSLYYSSKYLLMSLFSNSGALDAIS